MIYALMIILLLLIATALWLAWRLGMSMGRMDMVGRLIDCKDAEAWQYAHYLRADLVAEKSPKKVTKVTYEKTN